MLLRLRPFWALQWGRDGWTEDAWRQLVGHCMEHLERMLADGAEASQHLSRRAAAGGGGRARGSAVSLAEAHEERRWWAERALGLAAFLGEEPLGAGPPLLDDLDDKRMEQLLSSVFAHAALIAWCSPADP